MPNKVGIETAARVITATDDDASGFLYLGTNKGVYTLAAGLGISPREDARRIRCVEASLSRGGVLLPGVTLHLMTLTGEQGLSFYHLIDTMIQSPLQPCSWRGDQPVKHGIGVMWSLGGVAVGDTLIVKVTYEPL